MTSVVRQPFQTRTAHVRRSRSAGASPARPASLSVPESWCRSAKFSRCSAAGALSVAYRRLSARQAVERQMRKLTRRPKPYALIEFEVSTVICRSAFQRSCAIVWLMPGATKDERRIQAASAAQRQGQLGVRFGVHFSIRTGGFWRKPETLQTA